MTKSSWIDVGDTFILFNQQMKGNKREMIQLGVPIFGRIKEDAKSKDKITEIVLACYNTDNIIVVFRQYRANSISSPRCH